MCVFLNHADVLRDNPLGVATRRRLLCDYAEHFFSSEKLPVQHGFIDGGEIDGTDEVLEIVLGYDPEDSV